MSARPLFLICLLILPCLLHADSLSKSISWKGYALAEDVCNFYGGIKDGSIFTTAGRLTATLDLDHGQFAVGLLGIGQTRNQDLYTGAIQTPSSYSAQSEIRINDLAYQQNIIGNHTFARVGIMDINDYFAELPAANTLINTAYSDPIAIAANTQLPLYPFPGFGIMGQYDNKVTTVLLGLFQGNPKHQSTVFRHGSLAIGEVQAHLPQINPNAIKYDLKLGLWHYQQANQNLGNVQNGVYGIINANWSTPAHEFAAGVDFGATPKRSNNTPRSLAACLTISNVLPTREKDILQFGMGRAWNSSAKPETFYELGYVISIVDNLTLTPDLQYIIDPGGTYQNAWVGILRLTYPLL